ncbi:MAG: discoidin domain-containing protein, partial [Methylobacteriaceae bacterium]|nr:discoidin domain-containing protein [Methylobacteriaceae bacterium]
MPDSVSFGLIALDVPPKFQWRVSASDGDPFLAVDHNYTTGWILEPSKAPLLEIDLGEVTMLGGLEVYWGEQGVARYQFEASLDRLAWMHLCSTHHGEGGQDVFAFPPVAARFVRWTCDPEPDRGQEIVEINLYSPAGAASFLDEGRVAELGYSAAKVHLGGSLTVDFGYLRYPLGALIEWGETYGTVFSVHLSDDGKNFHEMGRILTGEGGTDNFWWRSTTSRYFRLTVHAASSPEGAVINELKLRILNKDRMPIGRLEQAALRGRGDLYPQSLLARQVYWTALGEFDHAEEVLFDEYGNLEPLRGSGQITPLLRLDGILHGAPASEAIDRSLAEGALPVPTVTWSAQDVELQATALAHAGEALVEYRIRNHGDALREGTLVLAVRPVQINPYWQHGGHAPINAISFDGAQLSVNNRSFVSFSTEPDAITMVEFNEGDVVKFIESGPLPTARSLRSGSGLLSAACEFAFSLSPGESIAFTAAAPMRDGITPQADMAFGAIRERVVRLWREKIGARRIIVGDREVSDTVEAQTALILVNATQFAYKPGPRNYDRIWIRDGSSQALALLWAGLVEEAKSYVVWYSKRIYENGMVPPILDMDGTVNRGYGSNIEFDAQGEFIGIAADIYRISHDRVFLKAIFEPVVRAAKFIEQLSARTNALYGPETRFHGLLAPSISHEGYNNPAYSYWDDFFALSGLRNCEYLASEIGDLDVAAYARRKG